jgi:hypothetical protein
MSVLNEPNRVSDWLKGEAESPPLFSREEVTVLSGQNLKSGTVIGKVAVGDVTGAADAGNAANTGTIGTLSAGAGAKRGVYTAVCIEPGTNAGKFEVQDPDGVVVGVATVAVAFAGPVNFTISDGSTDFVAGERFTITVADGSEKVKASPATGSDGSQVAAGILLYDVDASDADQPGVIVSRDAAVSQLGLTFDASVDDAPKKAAKMAQLAALRILQRDAA